MDLQGDAIRRLMESRAAGAASSATAEAKAKLGRLSLGGARARAHAVRTVRVGPGGGQKTTFGKYS